ncbi:6-phosphogluconolactonase [Chloroflexota bacterium]
MITTDRDQSAADIRVYPGKAQLAIAGAAHIIDLAKATIARQGLFSLALAGGSTPKEVYGLLTKAELDWEYIHLFWGDERCVPPEHPDSNYRMVKESLLDHINIPPANIHRIQGELSPEQAALAYERVLEDFFPKGQSFDLVLLGMGEDGHTASLFPGTPALKARRRWVAAVKHNQPPPPLVNRVSLTFPAINAARQVTFLISGAGKAERLKEVLGIPADAISPFPVQYVHPHSNALLWLLDQAAAG